MKGLGVNVHGWRYQFAVRKIEDTYRTASATLIEQIESVERRAIRIEKDMAMTAVSTMTTEGKAELIEAAEDQISDLVEDRDISESQLNGLRQAFTILLYHQWEKRAQRWFTHNGKPNGPEIIAALPKVGLTVHPMVDEIRMLTNVLKHNSKGDGPALFAARKDLFRSDFDPMKIFPLTNAPYKYVDYDDGIELNEGHMTDFFAAIGASGPDRNSVFIAPSQ